MHLSPTCRSSRTLRSAAALLGLVVALALPGQSSGAPASLPDSLGAGDDRRAIPTWLELARGRLEAGKTAEAGSALDSALACWEQDRARGGDAERAEADAGVADTLRSTCVEYLLRYPTTVPEPARIAAAYETAQRFRARTALERASDPRSFSAPAPGASPPSISIDEIQGRLLAPDELLLEWVCGPGSTRLFALTREERRVFSIADSRVLAAGIQSARRALESAPRGARDTKTAQAVAEELTRLLLGDALPLVTKAHALVLVPEGPLLQVPFAALVVRGQPLVTTVPVSVAPSMALVAEARASVGESPSQKLLAVQGAGFGPRGAAAEREITWLANTFQGVTLSRADRPAPDSTSLGLYEALHFAGRTTLEDPLPWRSGIDVGRWRARDAFGETRGAEGGGVGGTGGPLRAEAIAKLRLNARLVVLSSCGAAGGAPSGEAVAALSSAFFAAGASAVIASLWPVDDRTTESLVRALYRELAAGKPAAEALRAAQDHLRRTRGTQHPYYWAGFVALGDGATRLQLQASPIWKRGPRPVG